MSQYHTQEAYRLRQSARRANPVLIERIRCFYHIACINAWQGVVAEQLALFAHVGLTNVVTCVLGSPEDVEYVKQCASHNDVSLLIEHTSTDLALHEAPTLYEVWRWAKA